MFTGSHLAVLIINAIIPVLWIVIIIKNLVKYYELKVAYAQSNERLICLKERLPDVAENAPEEVKHYRQSAESMANVMMQGHATELKFARFNVIFWVVVGVGMTICSVLETIKVCVKLYHRECPCALTRYEQKVEGPKFTATLQNVKIEEGKKND